MSSGWNPAAAAAPFPSRQGAEDREPTLAEALLLLAKQEGGKLYALVDAARDETVLQKFAMEEAKSDSLFKGSQVEEQYYAVSPFLVECQENTEPFNWLATEAWGHSVGVFFSSSDSFVNLFTHFRRFLQIVTEDGKKLYFRFFDPRVLRVYLPTCTASELALLYGQVTCFFVESEDGEKVLTFGREDPGAGLVQANVGPTDSLGKLIIRKPQVDAFSESATKRFEDRMLTHLNRSYPKECETLMERKTRELIRLGIKRAKSYDIKSEKGVAKYIYTMFEFGRDFDKDSDYPWASQVLNDPGIADAAVRIEQLRTAAEGHQGEAKGILSESEV